MINEKLIEKDGTTFHFYDSFQWLIDYYSPDGHGWFGGQPYWVFCTFFHSYPIDKGVLSQFYRLVEFDCGQKPYGTNEGSR